MNELGDNKSDLFRAKEIFTRFLNIHGIDYVEKDNQVEFKRAHRYLAIFRAYDVILRDDKNNIVRKGSVFEIINHLSGSINILV